jgi:hypothetical protein
MDKLLIFYGKIVGILKVSKSSTIFDEELDVKKYINEGTRIYT